MEVDQIIRSVQNAYQKLGKKIDHLLRMRSAGIDQEVIEGIMIEAEAEGERLALLLRSLPTYTPIIRSGDDVDQVLKEIWPIRCEYTDEGWFKLTIPYLLPKKEGGGTEYLRRPLYLLMEEFFRKRPILWHYEAVIAYRHIYTKEYPERRMRDHDNIETNAVSDVLAMFLMPSDKPICCSHFETSDVGDEEKTEVYVLSPHDFPAWIVKYKSSMLYKSPRSKFDVARGKIRASDRKYEDAATDRKR